MSFICDCCFKSSQPGTPCHRHISETRFKEYEHSVTKGGDGEKEKYVKIYRSKGSEIVHEQKLCQSCINSRIDKEMIAKGKSVVLDFDHTKGIMVVPRPKRKSREEENTQFRIKLPYDILPSNFFHKLDGLEDLMKK